MKSQICVELKQEYLDDDFVRADNGVSFICLDELEEFVGIPEAEEYWIEADTKQWPDRSGQRVKLRCVSNCPWIRCQKMPGSMRIDRYSSYMDNGWWTYWNPRMEGWLPLYGELQDVLDEWLGTKEKVWTIWFRLLYR